MKIGDEVLYYVFGKNTDPIRIGTIVDIVEFKNNVTFYIIKSLLGGRTLARKKEFIYSLKSIKQLKKDIIGVK